MSVPHPDQLAAFAKSLRARGLEPRDYAAPAFAKLYEAARRVWLHMTDLDNNSLQPWLDMPVGSLANAWAEGNATVEPWSALKDSACRGNRTFRERAPESTSMGVHTEECLGTCRYDHDVNLHDCVAESFKLGAMVDAMAQAHEAEPQTTDCSGLGQPVAPWYFVQMWQGDFFSQCGMVNAVSHKDAVVVFKSTPGYDMDPCGGLWVTTVDMRSGEVDTDCDDVLDPMTRDEAAFVKQEDAALKAFDAKGSVGSTHATAMYECECGYEANSVTELMLHVNKCRTTNPVVPSSYASALHMIATVGAMCPTTEQLVDMAIIGLAHINTEREDWESDVINLFGAVPAKHRTALFRLLDGGRDCGPQVYGYTREVRGKDVEWHYKLRRVRNDVFMGKRLFAVLDERGES